MATMDESQQVRGAQRTHCLNCQYKENLEHQSQNCQREKQKMIEIKLKKSSKNGSIKKNSKIQIKKLVRTNTIHAFDAVCGHTKSFYTDSDGIILKKNSRAGMVFIQTLKNIFSKGILKCRGILKMSMSPKSEHFMLCQIHIF